MRYALSLSFYCRIVRASNTPPELWYDTDEGATQIGNQHPMSLRLYLHPPRGRYSNRVDSFHFSGGK